MPSSAAPELHVTRRPVRVHVRRRPETGQLYLDYFLAGQRFRKPTSLPDSTPNRRRAEREAAALSAQLTLGMAWPEGAVPEGAAVSFAQFAATWQADLAPRWRPRTRETVAGLVKCQLLPLLGDRPLRAITSAELYALRRALCEAREDGSRLSPKTINEALRLAARILGDAARRHGSDLDLEGLKVVEQPRLEVVPCTLEEMRRILACAQGQDRAVLTVAFCCGVRPGEIAGLRWEDVDFEQRVIRVRRTLGRSGVGMPKSTAGWRLVDATVRVMTALKEQKLRTAGWGEYVFQSAAGGALDMKNFASRIWKPLLAELGLAPQRLYITRHTYASLMLAAGENPAWIARQMGHETTEMLFRTYGHLVHRTRGQDGASFERMVAPESNRNAA